MASYNSGSYISTDSGKFRLECDVTVSSAGMVITPKLHISNGFKSSHTFELTYYANNTTKKTKKTAANGTTKKYKNAGTHKLTTFTIKDYRVSKAITLKLNGKTAKIAANTIKSTLKPPTPQFTINKTKPTFWDITVVGNGEEEQPVNKVYLESTDVRYPQEGDWESLNYALIGYHPSSTSDKAYEVTFHQAIEENRFYKFRVRVSGDRTGEEIFSNWVESGDYVSRPGETDDVGVDPETQTLTWTANLSDIDNHVIVGWYIYRAEGSGSFSKIATVSAVTGQVYYSWTDTSQAVGHTYRYKIVGFNAYGETWDTPETEVEIEGPPYAPSASDIHYYYNADGSVVIEVEYGDGVEKAYIERSTNGGASWTQIAELTNPECIYVDTAATSDSIYRVLFGNGAGKSEPSDPFQPAATVKPNPPTILLPVYHSNLSVAKGSVDIYWQHNSLDGSPQQTAQLQISKEDGTVLHTQTISDDSHQYTWDSSLVSPTVINIRLCTQGANDLWSEYSYTQFFLVREPQIVINSPSGTLTSLPVEVEFTYTPSGLDTGTEIYNSYLEELTVEVIDEGGDLYYKKKIDYDSHSTQPFTDTISLMDALFSSETEYTLQLTARETNGLSSKYITTFVIVYSDEVLAGSLYPIVNNDEETGYVYITISRDIGDDGEQEPAPVTKAYLYRNANSERIFLGEVKEDMQITDMLAPVNKDITYDLLQLYSDGTASLVTVEAYNPCNYSYIYWGNRLDKIAKALWNPTQSTSMGRPERTLVRYSGRQYPVVYDSKAREETASFTAVLESEDLDDFISVMLNGGTGIWKSVQGRAFNASFDLDFQRVDSNYNIELYECTLKVERVED